MTPKEKITIITIPFFLILSFYSNIHFHFDKISWIFLGMTSFLYVFYVFAILAHIRLRERIKRLIEKGIEDEEKE